MIKGIGVDLVQLSRIDLNHRHFIERVLTEKELAVFDSLLSPERKKEYFGSRFAAKEAYLKAHHCGLGKISFQKIEIFNDETGCPHFTDDCAWLSISHEQDYAIAFVVVEGEEKS